jgi:hypothetical protein
MIVKNFNYINATFLLSICVAYLLSPGVLFDAYFLVWWVCRGKAIFTSVILPLNIGLKFPLFLIHYPVIATTLSSSYSLLCGFIVCVYFFILSFIYFLPYIMKTFKHTERYWELYTEISWSTHLLPTSKNDHASHSLFSLSPLIFSLKFLENQMPGIIDISQQHPQDTCLNHSVTQKCLTYLYSEVVCLLQEGRLLMYTAQFVCLEHLTKLAHISPHSHVWVITPPTEFLEFLLWSLMY